MCSGLADDRKVGEILLALHHRRGKCDVVSVLSMNKIDFDHCTEANEVFMRDPFSFTSSVGQSGRQNELSDNFSLNIEKAPIASIPA
jgi:hypothetical protein